MNENSEKTDRVQDALKADQKFRQTILLLAAIIGSLLLFSALFQDGPAYLVGILFDHPFSILLGSITLILAYQKLFPDFINSRQSSNLISSIANRIEELEQHLKKAESGDSQIDQHELHEELGDHYQELWRTVKDDPQKSAYCFRKSVFQYEKSLTGYNPDSQMFAMLHLKLGRLKNSYLGTSTGIINISDTLTSETLTNLCKAIDGCKKTKDRSVLAESSYQLGILYQRLFLQNGDKDYLNMAYAAFEEVHECFEASNESGVEILSYEKQELYRKNLLLMSNMAIIRSRYIENSEELQHTLSLCQKLVTSLDFDEKDPEYHQFDVLIKELDELMSPEKEVVIADLKRLISSL